MRRGWWLASVLMLGAACGRIGFEPRTEDAGAPSEAGTALVDAGPRDGGGHDASADDAGPTDAGPTDAGPVDAGPVDAGAIDAGVPFCPSDPSLVGCWALDGDLADGASGARPMVATGIGFAAGRSGQALTRDAAASVRIADSETLTWPELTIELWFRPESLPSSGRAGLIDKQGQFGLFLQATGEVRCTAGGGAVSCGGVATDGFRHVACTHDGSQLRLYLDGAMCDETSAGAIAAGTDAIHVGEDSPSGGDGFVGAIDQVRLWSTAREAADICDAADAC